MGSSRRCITEKKGRRWVECGYRRMLSCRIDTRERDGMHGLTEEGSIGERHIRSHHGQGHQPMDL